MQKRRSSWKSLTGVAWRTLISMAAMIPAGALAAAPEKCSEPQTKNCEPLRPLADDQLKESLKKTLPGALAPLLETDLADLIVSVRAQSSHLEPGDAMDLQLVCKISERRRRILAKRARRYCGF